MKNVTDDNTGDASQLDPGLSLDQLRRIQEVYGLDARAFYAEEPGTEGLTRFRKAVKETLSDSDHFIIVNFLGTVIGNTTEGHISPLGAYDEKTDSILVLDVAGHKNPWYWVPASLLYEAMHTKADGGFRGWLIVSDPAAGKTGHE